MQINVNGGFNEKCSFDYTNKTRQTYRMELNQNCITNGRVFIMNSKLNQVILCQCMIIKFYQIFIKNQYYEKIKYQ